VNIIPARQYFDFFSLGIITNQRLRRDNPHLISRFVKVSLASLESALGNKDEALAAFIKITPNAVSRMNRVSRTRRKGLVDHSP